MRSAPSTQADALLARARRLLHDHKTRARKDGAVLDYTLADVRQLLESSPCCTYCALPLGWDASLDQRLPIGRGGRHQLANIAVSCSRCNGIKGMLAEAEFRELLTLLAQLHPAAAADLERRLLAGGRRYSTGRRKPGPLEFQ